MFLFNNMLVVWSIGLNFPLTSEVIKGRPSCMQGVECVNDCMFCWYVLYLLLTVECLPVLHCSLTHIAKHTKLHTPPGYITLTTDKMVRNVFHPMIKLEAVK